MPHAAPSAKRLMRVMHHEPRCDRMVTDDQEVPGPHSEGYWPNTHVARPGRMMPFWGIRFPQTYSGEEQGPVIANRIFAESGGMTEKAVLKTQALAREQALEFASRLDRAAIVDITESSLILAVTNRNLCAVTVWYYQD